MNLENKINEISQTQKTNIHLSEVSRIGKCIETQKQNTGYRGWGWEQGELFNGYKVSMWDDEKF